MEEVSSVGEAIELYVPFPFLLSHPLNPSILVVSCQDPSQYYLSQPLGNLNDNYPDTLNFMNYTTGI